MICYRCNHEAGSNDTCQVCGTDIHLFQKAIRLSNVYYNDGLQKAQVRNLSGAIVSLKKSLKFNKYHIDARNLLGLVYYEMGEVVDALSEWVISKSYQQDDNAAGRYLDELRHNRGQLDAANQTIKKYNKALYYCKNDSRDLAIIQLKKVLSMNPKLVKGHQLLALLYIQDERYEQAKKALRNAAKIDANNTITLRYLKEVNLRLKDKSSSKKKKEENLISYQSGNETIIMPTRFQDYSLGSTLVYLFIGLLVGALVIGFLVVPEVKSKAKQDMQEQLIAADKTLSSNLQQISSMQEQITQLEAQLAEFTGQSEVLPEQIAAYEALLSANVAYMANDKFLAGENLEKIDVDQLSDTAQGVYTTLMTEVATVFYDELYRQGYSFYSQNNYTEAIAQLLRVVNYDMSYNDGYACYYLAQAYRRNSETDAAKPYYQYVIDNYPHTERAATAKNYINEE